MSDKVYIGQNVAEMDYGDTLTRVSRVNLAVDSDHIYTSGDDTGRTLEVDCPWGSQEMADSILAKMSAVDYQPYTAEQAILDPAAEIGDGVTIGGIYSQISTSNIEFDKMCVSGISAPESDEIDDEYPYESSAQKEIERKLAYTRSLISKTSEQILLQVESELKGISSSFSVKLDEITARVAGAEDSIQVTINLLDGLTITDSSGTTKIKGSSIATNSITADQIDTSTLIVGDNIQMGENATISWNKVSDAPTIPTNMSQLENDSGYATETYVTNLGYQTASQVTTITNDAISTATISCDQISTGTIQMTHGYLGEVTGSTGTGITSGVGIMSSASGSSCVVTSAGARMSYDSLTEIYAINGQAVLKAGDVALGWHSNGYFYAETEDSYLGASYYPWGVIYSKDGTVQTSDRNKKKNIYYGLEAYDGFFDGLKPVSYKFIDGKRTHIGLISQDVEDGLESNSLTAMDFAGFCKDLNEDGSGYDYALRYDEFVALCIWEIQRLKARVAVLEGA